MIDKEKYAWFLNAPPAPGQEEIPNIEQLKTEREPLELVEELRKAVQLVKDSGDTDANKAFVARASAVAKLLNVIRRLNEAS